MTTFVLIHGAWHGAWCWSLLEPELAARGHESVSMDLPAEDGTATLADYAQVVLAAIPPDADDIVVVGHSLGSLVVPLVAAARPVALQVFLCGIVPNLDGSPWAGAPPMAEPDILQGIEQHEDGSTAWRDVESATRAFYGDCSPELAAWAFAHLRPQNMTSLGGPYPLSALPGGRVAAIVGAEDRAVTPEFSKAMCEQRLGGIEPIVLPGGHSPFLARPAALADVLVSLAATPG
jgi:pimeloyl-ACP methyl ester carboxylesterase